MSDFLRSLFGSKKSTSKIKPRVQGKRLELLGLEERIVPVINVSFSGSTLLLASDNNDTFTVSSSNTGEVTVVSQSAVTPISSSGVTIQTTGQSNVITVTSGASNVGTISITGAGSSNDQIVTLNDILSGAFNSNFGLSISLGTDNVGDQLTLGGTITLKGSGGLDTSFSSSNIEFITLGTNSALALSSASGSVILDADSGEISLSNNVSITSTSGNIALADDVIGGSKNLTINAGSGNVSTLQLGKTTPIGDVSLTSAGDVSVSGTVSATSVNAKSSTGDVIFGGQVTTSATGGFTSEATSATKATKISGQIMVQNGANALVTGNLISNGPSTISTFLNGTINITGKVDAAAVNKSLSLFAAGDGAITIGGAVGSGPNALATLTINGRGAFLASDTVTAGDIYVGQSFSSQTSVTFAKAVVTTGANGIFVDTSNAGTITFSESITSTNATGVIDLQTVNGNLTVIGAINTKRQVNIQSAAGAVVLSGNITNDGTTIQGNENGVFISIGSGSLTTSGTITAVGNNVGEGGIQIETISSSGVITVNGALSTTGGGAIRLQAGIGSGINQMSVNASVTTSGTTAGEIIVYANGGSVTLNQPVTVGTAGKILLSTGLSTDTITINSGAAISAGTNIYDTDSGRGYLSAGKINLAANLTTTLGKIDLEPVGGITLSGPVSMKAQGTTVGDIILGSINGAQNLTLEATDQIHFKNSVGQTVALNTLTVTNSRLVLFDGDLTAANVILTNTATTIFFKGNTTITSSLTTTANAYNLYFDIGKSVVIAGAPVFLNTGYLSLFGTTSLPSGATITGGSLANVNLAGTIVSGGAFNIGAGLSNINISDTTKLILNSTTSGSTFASPISLDLTRAGSFNLLGLGTLTLSANSTAGITTGDTINVINGTLNVTGTLGSASTVTLTNGTLTGPGGTVGNLVPTIGTVDPQGTLQTGAVTFNAATTYIADVLTPTTATNLQGNASFNLGGAILSLSSVAAGLAVGNTFTIIDNTAATGTNLITTTFAGLPEGATLSAIDASGNTVVFTISYIGGTGANDVTLTVSNVIVPINLPIQPMVVGQPVLNKFTLTGADTGGGPLVTVTFSDGTYTTFFAYASTFTGGVRVAAADVNGDGILDIITGAGPGGGPQVNVFSFNSTGQVVLSQSFFAFNTSSFTGGVYVAAGDTNNDGFDDVVIGAGASGGPRVQVYAGSATGVVTSSTLNDFFAYSSAFTGGVVVAAGDRTGDSFGNQEVITGPASNGGFNVKSFDVNGKGNSPTLVDNFFAFNDTTSIGGLSLASSPFGGGAVQDILIGSTNTQFGVVVDQTGDSSPVTITTNPFPGFTGAIRAGIAIDSNDTRYAIAAAGPGGGPVISLFSVGANSLTQTDSLFVLNPAFTGGLFASS